MISLLCKHRWTYEEIITGHHIQFNEPIPWDDYKVVATCQWCGKKRITAVGARRVKAVKNERPNK